MVHERLLEIAIREFGSNGLDGASTRSIAAQAGTAMSSITYHYGSKEGLYLAAADYIASEMDDVVGEFSIDAIISFEDRAAARQAIKTILLRMVDKIAEERSENWSLFILREQMRPTEAFDRIYAGPMGKMLVGLAELVCVATGTSDRRAARVAMLTLFGQSLVIRMTRAACAKLFGEGADDPDLIDQFKQRIAANADAILQSMTNEARGQA